MDRNETWRAFSGDFLTPWTCSAITPDGYFASDGICTHEDERLEDGIVIDNVIECPLHQGRFDLRTGEALSAPVCVNLRTYPVRIEDGRVLLGLPAEN